MNDVIVNKLQTIERCIHRITEVYNENSQGFSADYTRQDSVVLNLQRACEACIDVANVINKNKQLGIPQSSRDSFQLLSKAGLLSDHLTDNLKKMIGLRNIAVHDYQELNIDIVKHVVEHHLQYFNEFSQAIKKLLGS